MQAIKALVIGLGVLIAISIGLLIYGFYAGYADPSPARGSRDPGGPTEPSNTVLPVPQTCRIVDAVADGRRIVIRTGDASECQRVFVVDTKSNTIVTRIRIQP